MHATRRENDDGVLEIMSNKEEMKKENRKRENYKNIAAT